MQHAVDSRSLPPRSASDPASDTSRSYPRTVSCEGEDVQLRTMKATDQQAVLAFARSLPTHDLLFLRRDITQPKVVAAWAKEVAQGAIASVLALRDGAVVGCLALVRDEFSWSAHVGDVRVAVTPEMRGKGLGRLLAQETLMLARGLSLRKLTAQMTVDQHGAISVFESLGFRNEALLRDHVVDRDGREHDIAILSRDLGSP